MLARFDVIDLQRPFARGYTAQCALSVGSRPSYWAQIADEKKGTGQPNLNGSKLEKLKVPIPPLDEQGRIVAELNALQVQMDALKSLQAETAAELDALMPSILDKAFHSEL